MFPFQYFVHFSDAHLDVRSHSQSPFRLLASLPVMPTSSIKAYFSTFSWIYSRCLSHKHSAAKEFSPFRNRIHRVSKKYCKFLQKIPLRSWHHACPFQLNWYSGTTMFYAIVIWPEGFDSLKLGFLLRSIIPCIQQFGLLKALHSALLLLVLWSPYAEVNRLVIKRYLQQYCSMPRNLLLLFEYFLSSTPFFQ